MGREPKTTNKAKLVILIAGGILIIIGFIVQESPIKSENKFGSTKVGTTTQTASPRDNTPISNNSQPRHQNNNPVNSSSSSRASTQEQTQIQTPPPTPVEDFSSYVNSSISNSEHIDISVIILDQNGNNLSPMSSSIAGIYTKAGYRTTTGLLRNSFIHKAEFQDLEKADSDIISKLNLNNYTDFLAIGRVSFSMRSGQLVSGTTICSASLTVSIINVLSQSIQNSFIISDISGNGITEEQAKDAAIQKLLYNYLNNYSNL